MKFILQTINDKVTLDMCFQMERALEYWNWRDYHNSFPIIYCKLETIGMVDRFFDGLKPFDPKEWCPIGTVEFVEKYIRTYFGDEVADNAMKPLNVPSCFTRYAKEFQKIYTGRYVFNTSLEYKSYKGDKSTYMIKDMDHIKNPNNGMMTLTKAKDLGLKNVQVSEIIRDSDLISEWRCFIHNGKVVDIKNYSGDPLAFPNREKVESLCNCLDDMLKECK